MSESKTTVSRVQFFKACEALKALVDRFAETNGTATHEPVTA